MRRYPYLVHKRVMILGATGFIGANLVRELIQQGAEVHILSRSSSDLWRLKDILTQLRLHHGDLTESQELHNIFARVQPELTFDLAVCRKETSKQDRQQTFQTNVLGMFNLMEAISHLDHHKLVYLASSLEYGQRKKHLKESDHLEPVTFYGATKATATILCQQMARQQGQPSTILRIFSAYGPWEAGHRLIPTAIMAVLTGGSLALTTPGYRRDFVYVEDVVQACLLAGEKIMAWGEIINIASGQQTKNEQVVEIIQDISGRRIDLRIGEYPARPSDTTHWVADIHKAKHLLGWKPAHSLRQGIEKTIAWFQDHQDLYGWGKST